VVQEDGSLKSRSAQETKEFWDSLPDPRVFKQHVLWDEVAIPEDDQVKSKVKYLTIVRDIRDLPFRFVLSSTLLRMFVP
jgi:hypothetical protein